MTRLRLIGATLAIAGILPATFGILYILGGTWLMTSLHVTVRLVTMGTIGSAMVWAGLWLWDKPLRDGRQKQSRVEL
ncbi:MAG: hypothetical protein JSS02_33710 [Planctomycetes bacterium]|nr:hypothetical protein [Planctomycetota bacterium]